MNYRDTVRKCLLYYSHIYPNRFSVDDQLFLVTGNGFSWVDGELVGDFGGSAFNHLFPKYHIPLIKKGPLRLRISVFLESAKFDIKYVWESICGIFTVQKRYIKYVPESSLYPISKYSKICNFPDNIKQDWAEAMLEFIRYIKDSSCLEVLEFKKDPKVGEILENTERRLLKIIGDF